MSDITHHEVPRGHCPTCRTELEAATGIDRDEPPSPGDITVCFYCGAIARFDQALHLSEVDPEEKRRLMDESPTLRRVVTELHRREPRGRS